jgi:phosphopantothenoylcysteine synthetase/decarboxylase
MKVIVTTGPSYEPIDEVRRLTNFSTGELGVMLSNQLAKAGFEVFCLRGVSSTHSGALEQCHHQPFTTNDDLLDHLARLSRAHEIIAIFHVAALCDFKVKQILDAEGRASDAPKIDSRSGSLTLVLEPAPKVLGQLRTLFPHATIVAWKYELVGQREDALAKAWRQLREHQADACVVNGRAYGRGFALCIPPDQIRELRDKSEVAQFLPGWLGEFRRRGPAGSTGQAWR